jgi:hypothetical protein
VGEGDFAGRGIDVATEQASVAGGVMRRAEGTLRDERLTGFQQADDAVDLGRLQRLVERERRKNRREPFREHGFASARRADEQDIVAARCRDLQRALHGFLAFDFGKIMLVVRRVLKKLFDIHACRRNLDRTFQKLCGLRASTKKD